MKSRAQIRARDGVCEMEKNALHSNDDFDFPSTVCCLPRCAGDCASCTGVLLPPSVGVATPWDSLNAWEGVLLPPVTVVVHCVGDCASCAGVVLTMVIVVVHCAGDCASCAGVVLSMVTAVAHCAGDCASCTGVQLLPSVSVMTLWDSLNAWEGVLLPPVTVVVHCVGNCASCAGVVPLQCPSRPPSPWGSPSSSISCCRCSVSSAARPGRVGASSSWLLLLSSTSAASARPTPSSPGDIGDVREQIISRAVLLPGLSGFFRSPSLRDGGCGAGDSVVSIAVGAGAAAVVVVDVDSVLAVRRMRKRRKGRRMSSRSFLFVAASRPVTRVQTEWICCDSWVRRSGCCCIFFVVYDR